MAADDDKDGSIQAAVNAFERGKTLLQKICRLAERPDTIFPEDTLMAVQDLESCLSQSVHKIEDSYNRNQNDFGKPFTAALAANRKL
jgi:hypothetical protein